MDDALSRLQSAVAGLPSDQSRQLVALADELTASCRQLADQKTSLETVARQQQAWIQAAQVISSKAVANLRQVLEMSQPGAFAQVASGSDLEDLDRLVGYVRNMVIANRRALQEVENKETQAEELSQQLERFKYAVDNAADFITMLDADFRVVYANAAVKARTGYAGAEGKPLDEQWWSHVDPAEREERKAQLTAQRTDQNNFSFEIKGNSLDGEEFPMAVHSTTIRGEQGDVKLILDISRDISKERSLEKLKDEFVSIASHELRTPMTVIRGYTQILASEKAGPLNDKQKDYLHRMASNTQMLIELVGDMLSLGKLEANKLTFHLQPTGIRSVVDTAVEKFRDMYTEKGIKLVSDLDEATAITDPDRIDQVLTNLLSNAYKFTPAGGTVAVFSQPYAADPSCIMIAVEDTGIGIPREARNALFKKFSQVDNVLQRQAGGTGLGLAICKDIVERLGGKIWVEDRREGTGTRFCFTLPSGEAQNAVSPGIINDK